MTRLPKRKSILPDALKELERHDGKVVTAGRIAQAIKADQADVRRTLTNYVWAHKTGPVVRVGTGIFRWQAEAGAERPTSGAPVSSPPVEQPAPAVIHYGDVVSGPVRYVFNLVKQMEDGRMLLEDSSGRLWIAREV